MNYLAHIYLADTSNTSLVGNFLGDFVKGNLKEQYPEQIMFGIKLHRKIDAFTDAHPIVLKSKRRLPQTFRRFTGIVIDILYDHFLAKHWKQFHTIPLQQFSYAFYKDLFKQLLLLPRPVQKLYPFMVQQNWLTEYETLPGIYRTFNRLSHRFSRVTPLDQVQELQHKLLTDLEEDFHLFFHELTEYVLNEAQKPRLVPSTS